ncbi:hypothetical protein Q6255_26915, partial [Klebsiella pneumoniae]|uniref:hypothetical protein n=1 Tax=Klebsiella pneumoniae TaxID=573 RepID=UPI00272F5281
LYDADGELLIKRPKNSGTGRTTLYLGGTEVRANKNTAGAWTINALRYYDFNGQTVGVRKNSDLRFIATDNSGTVNASW